MDYVEVDLGKTSEVSNMQEPMQDAEVYYPELYMHDVGLPDIPDGEFVAKVKLCKKSYSVNKDPEGNVTGKSCSFYVKKLMVPEKEEKVEDSAEMFEKAVMEMEG
jgi:hypothetical protein